MDIPSDSSQPVLFVSHAPIDGEIAQHAKKIIVLASPNIEVFVSSDPEDLPIGDPWVERILTALDRAKLVIVLATERGLGRKWVWFEAGAGWDRRRKIVTCCMGTTRKNALPPPFSLHTALNIDEESDLRSFFGLLANEFGSATIQIDYPQLAKEIARLDVRAEERQKTINLEDEERPFFDFRSEAVKRKLNELGQGGRDLIRLVLTYGELDNSRICSAWRRGYEVTPTIKIVSESGLLLKRYDRVNNIEVAWYFRTNPDLEQLLRKMLFPSDEQEGGPYFQA